MTSRSPARPAGQPSATAASPLILALPGGQALAERLARQLHCEAAPLAVHRFPDGETLPRLPVPVQGRDVVLAGSLNQPDGKTLPLLFAADAARELGAARIGLVAPYLAYMRQDQRFQPGEAVTSRSYARLLSASLDYLITVDPHLHRWHGLEEIYPIPTHRVAAAPAIAQWVRRHAPEALLVGPDAESRQWVSEVARLAGLPFAVLSKVRRGDRDVRIRLPRARQWAGRQPVLLDDIVSTGHTLAAAGAALRGAGLAPPLCIAVHALFDANAPRLLADAGFARVLTCDTVEHPTNAIRLGPLLARALRAALRGKAT